MKYRLIDKTTGIETLCDKVTIDGFDYYVSDEKLKVKDKFYFEIDGVSDILEVESEFHLERISEHLENKKVIATTNPNIDIPKVVDEVEMLAHKYFAEERFNWEQENPNGLKAPQSLIKHYNKTFTPLFRAGYNKSQETHPFSEEDMIDFAEFYFREEFNATMQDYKSSKEILRLWKEQQLKTVYYE